MDIPVYKEFELEGTRKRIVVATVDVRVDLGTTQGRQALADSLRQMMNRMEPIDDG
jgi:hypothetical protein